MTVYRCFFVIFIFDIICQIMYNCDWKIAIILAIKEIEAISFSTDDGP